jgi:hypothetical protein
MLARAGAELMFVTAGFSPLSPRLIDNFEGRFIVKRLKEVGVQFVPTSWLRRIEAGAAVLYDMHTGEERREAVDAVVLCTGREPQDGLARALEGRVTQLFTIGDALAARPLAAASYEGQKFARLIGEDGAPRSISEAFFRADDPAVTPFPADVRR